MSAMNRGLFPKVALSLAVLLLAGTGCAELDRIFGQPYVEISSPTNGQIVQGNTVTVEGTAEDGVGVTRLVYELQNSEGKSGERDIFAFYSDTSQAFSFEITDLAPGTNTITVVAYDGDGYRNQSAVSVIVEDAAVQPFDIVFTSPDPDLTTIDTEVAFAGTILDSGGDPVPLTALRFEVSNSQGKNPEVDALDGYDAEAGTFAFTAEDLQIGRNTLTLTATDETGRVAEADITVTVEAPAPVALTLTAPVVGETPALIYGKTLALAADLGGNIPVTALTYAIGDAEPIDILSDLNDERQLLSRVTDLEAGDYTLEVVARDARDNEAKATVSVKVVTDVEPVALTLLSEDTDLEAGDTLSVTGTLGAAQAVASVRYHFGDPTAAVTLPAEALVAATGRDEDPYPLDWDVAFAPDLTGLTPGAVTLTAIAQDLAGNEVEATLKFNIAGEVVAACGDGIIADGEQCDGDQLNGASCVDFGFAEGTLSCSATCGLEQTACSGASFVGVRVGLDAACGLLGDKKLSCWGFDAYPRNGQFTALDLGGDGLCAVRLDSTLSCYGAGLNTPPDELFSGVVVGAADVCGVLASGQALCWPALAADGADTFTNPSGEALISVTTSPTSDTFCGLTAAGAVECWDRQGARGAPAEAQLVSLSAAGNVFCGLTGEGAASCWKDDVSVDPEVPNAEPLTALVQGDAHRCGLTLTGEALCWGDNLVGQLDAPAGVRFKALSASGDNTCGVDATSGLVACWGPAAAAGTLPTK